MRIIYIVLTLVFSCSNTDAGFKLFLPLVAWRLFPDDLEKSDLLF